MKLSSIIRYNVNAGLYFQVADASLLHRKLVLSEQTAFLQRKDCRLKMVGVIIETLYHEPEAADWMASALALPSRTAPKRV